jgi:hypothetical protein
MRASPERARLEIAQSRPLPPLVTLNYRGIELSRGLYLKQQLLGWHWQLSKSKAKEELRHGSRRSL